MTLSPVPEPIPADAPTADRPVADAGDPTTAATQDAAVDPPHGATDGAADDVSDDAAVDAALTAELAELEEALALAAADLRAIDADG